jgi:hypothetical protein
MNWRNLYLIFGCLLALGACTKMYFPKPLPSQGKTVMELPHFLKGRFLKKQEKTESGGMEYLEIKRFNEQHCRIYTSYAFSKDSLDQMIKGLNTDSSSAVLKGNTLIYMMRDTIEKTVLERDGNLFYTPKDTLCEIDLASAKFWDDFPDGEAKKLQLKKLGETYYLNVLEKNVGDSGKDCWFVVKFDFQQSEMSITNTSINDSTFSKRLDYYNKIARIDKLGSSQYLCNAGDEAFFKLFEEPGLFERVVWESVADEQKLGLFNVVGLVVLGVVVLGVVIFGVRFFFSRKRANPS